MKLALCAVLLVGGCGGDSSSSSSGDASIGTDVGGAGADAHVQDPSDPVEDVPAYTGIYTFAKLTTDESLTAAAGTWFTDSSTEHKVSDTRMTYARYRDEMVLQSMTAAKIYLYDQAAGTIGTAIDLPSDAVGRAIIRGGLLFIGGAGKLYSYEIATGMWRMREIAGAGGCHHLAAGATRLFAMCRNPTTPANDDVFSTWANTTMSDVTPVGTLAPGEGPDLSWITAAPGEDIAYFGSNNPDGGCIGRATWNALDACVFSLRTLTTATTANVADGQVSEHGDILYVTYYTQGSQDKTLEEIVLGTPAVAHYVRAVESYATCPDNSVTFQDFTISQRRAGGVNTDVRLGGGGERFMGCPLKKQ